MSKIENFEIEPSEETWAMRREGRGLVAPARKSACKCGRCRLYGWYPPLLVVSTIMTAVFCFLYLTKPVFLQAPVMKVNDGGKKIPPGYMIAGSGGPEGMESSTVSESTMPRELDPGRLGFSVETREMDPLVAALSQPEPIDLLDVPPMAPPVKAEPVAAPPVMKPVVFERSEPIPVRVSVGNRSESTEPALPGAFQPLRVEKADRPLFQSLTKGDMERLDERRSAEAAPALESSEELEEPDFVEAVIDPVVAALMIDGVDEISDEAGVGVATVVEEPGRVEVEEPVMKASFIGEFYQDEEDNAGAVEILSKTVMR